MAGLNTVRYAEPDYWEGTCGRAEHVTVALEDRRGQGSVTPALLLLLQLQSLLHRLLLPLGCGPLPASCIMI